MPFAAPIRDNFNRADNASLGASWTSNVFNNGASSPAIVSNQCAAVSGGAYSSAHYNVAQYGPHTFGGFTISTMPADLSAVSINLRITDPTTSLFDGFQLYFERRAATDIMQFWEATNGTFTQLGTDVSQELAAGDILYCEIVGARFRAYFQSGGAWTFIAERTSTLHNNAGFAAIEITSSAARIDNFFAGTLRVVETITSTSTGMIPTLKGV